MPDAYRDPAHKFGFANYQARLMCGDPMIVGYDKIVKLSKRWSVTDRALSPSFLISQALYVLRERSNKGRSRYLIKTSSSTAINELHQLWDPLEQYLGRVIPARSRTPFLTLERICDIRPKSYSSWSFP